MKACAIEQEFSEPQPDYSEGREDIHMKPEAIQETLGNVLKEEAEKAEENPEEAKAPAAPQDM